MHFYYHFSIAKTLIHRYTFNDGTASDVIGGISWMGTIGAGASISNGKFILNGIPGSYLQLPADLLGNSSAISIEGWVTTRSNSDFARVFQLGKNIGSSWIGASYSMTLMNINDLFCFVFYPSPNVDIAVCTGATFDNKPNTHFVIVLKDQDYAKVYINGLLVGITSTVISVPESIHDTINRFGAGTDTYNGGYPLNGDIDEIRIWNGSLSQADISANYIAGADNLYLSELLLLLFLDQIYDIICLLIIVMNLIIAYNNISYSNYDIGDD